MDFFKKENVNIAYECIADTPRTAVYLYLAPEKTPLSGVHVILGNLLMKGTKTRTGEALASELENLGIEVSVDSRADFLKISILCLDEDIETAFDIVNDFMLNSTFETFEKEVFKFKNETTASLDSAVTKASDAYYREIFKGHIYGVTNTKIMETIDNMTVGDVISYHKSLLEGRKIVSVATGNKDKDFLVNLVTSKLTCMKSEFEPVSITEPVNKKSGKLIKIAKNDAKQAQIFQGWIVDGINTEDCPKLAVLDGVLGASGLSSRLFVELRDKRGLAYTVRSNYKTSKQGACFVLYIGTEPANIKKSLDGFKSEIQRLIDEPPTEDEIKGAIENYTGKYKYFYTQTNAQIASSNGGNYINGFGFDYDKKLLEKIAKVTKDDVVEAARKYLSDDPVTVVLAPEEYLKF